MANASTLVVSGGTSNVSAINGTGLLRLNSGTLNLNSDLTFDGTTLALQVGGGTLGGTGALTINQALALPSVTFTGTGALTTNAATTITGTVTDAGKPWVNNGAMAINGSSTLSINGNAVVTNSAGATIGLNDTSAILIGQSRGGGGSRLDNAGTITIASTNATPVAYAGGNFGVFNNTGTINKTSVDFQNFEGENVFNNTGTINVQAGRLNLDNGTPLAGTVDVTGGATLGLPNNMTSNGRLQGTGTIVMGDGTGTLLNNGTIAPAGTGATGTLSLTGNLTQGGSGVTELEVAGTGAGQFDVLQVSGTANLGGTLKLATLGGYTGNPGDNFPALVVYNSHTGTYSSITLPPGVTGTPAVGATGVSLAFTSAIDCGGADVCWVGTSGDWSIPGNWSTGALPTARQSVLIDVPGLQTVTISAGTHVAGSITVEEIFSLSGGSLTVGGQSTFNNAFNVAGGIFNGNGNVSVSQLNLSGGALNLAGGRTATLSGASAWSGGTLSGTGATFAITNAASLALTGDIDHVLSGLTIDNAGTMTLALAGNRLLIDNGATLNNSGTVRFIGGADTIGSSQGGSLVNTGIIRNANTTGDATITGVVFRNTGGTLATGAGRLIIDAATTLEGTTTFVGDNVELGGGQIVADGSVLNGAVKFTGGPSQFGNTTINGTLTNASGTAMSIGAGKTLTIAGPGRGLFSATSILGGGDIVNRGQLTLDGVTLAGSLVNEGSLDIAAGASSVDGAVLTLSTGILDLAAGGTLTKNGGAASWNGGTITGNGSLIVAGGGTFALGGAGARMLDGPTLTVPTLTVPAGSLTLQSGALNVSDATTIDSGASLTRNGGSFNPGGVLTNNGTLTLATGDTQIAGGSSNAGTLNLRNATITIAQTVAKAGTFTNTGAFNLGTNGGMTIGANGSFANNASGVFTFAADSGNIALADARTITNSGAFISRGGNHSIGNGGSALFDNTPGGVVRVDGGRFILLMNASALDHGAYSVASGGSLEFPDQTRTFAADSSISGDGTVVFRSSSLGALNLNGTYNVTGTTQVQGNTTVQVGSTATIGTLDQSGGTIGGGGNLNIGALDQSGGTFGGTGNLTVTNSFNRTGGTFGTGLNAVDITHRTGNLAITSPLQAQGNLTLDVTTGNLTVNDTRVTAGGTLTVSARNITVAANTGSALMQGADLRVTTSGDLVIRGGAGAESTATVRSTANPCTGAIGGNLVVAGGTGSGANASFVGTPDIESHAAPFSIGGEVRMTSIDGRGTARVASINNASIHLLFPNRASGGFSVNGAAVTSAGSSGFFADGRRAVLGSNLLISYGGTGGELPTTTEASAIVAQTIVPPPTPPFPLARGPRAADETAAVVDNTKALPGECR